MNKNGFTLIEILIVVLIIGLLTSIAVPGYKKAVEKSKVADALTTMSAVAKSEHGFYLAKNTYTKDFADLDIALIDKDGNKAEDSSFETVNYTFTLQNKSVKATRANGEYALYKLYEDNDIYCLPQDHYICQQYDWGMNRNACENGLEGAWSNIKTTCYNTPQERCADNDEYGATWKNRNGYFCGFNGGNGVRVEEFQECRDAYAQCNNSTFTGEGAKCIGGGTSSCNNSEYHQGAECYGSCNNSTFTTGGICYGGGSHCTGGNFSSNSKCISSGNNGCNGGTFSDGAECISSPNTGGGCRNATFKSGSKCIANGGEWGACNSFYGTAVFEPGSICVGNTKNTCRETSNFQGICVANKSGTCVNSYTGDGCCCGNFCGNNPKCVDKGITCPEL